MARSPLATVVLTALCLLGSLQSAGVAAATASGLKLFRYTDVNEAREAARKSGRPVLVYVSGEHCPYCRKMRRETFSRPKVVECLRDSFESVDVVNEEQPQVTKQFRVRILPTTIVLSPEGTVLTRVEGFVAEKKFSSQVDEALVQNRAEHPAATAQREDFADDAAL